MVKTVFQRHIFHCIRFKFCAKITEKLVKNIFVEIKRNFDQGYFKLLGYVITVQFVKRKKTLRVKLVLPGN